MADTRPEAVARRFRAKLCHVRVSDIRDDEMKVRCSIADLARLIRQVRAADARLVSQVRSAAPSAAWDCGIQAAADAIRAQNTRDAGTTGE